ncbi:hypothetical protein XBI1_730003 [Xenorhabdus bovienii str. Intermedium]|uniref:Uncharacterized protein n=1 Tax=Xenorhabdus bovienii str. Intermedium TaxID=1379677 RepID=A0A077QR21_XENBV|nr:hypothetical protein XBI1_730003 [Xenorhabdus bovienii str. Intermedium]
MLCGTGLPTSPALLTTYKYGYAFYNETRSRQRSEQPPLLGGWDI